MKLTWLAAALAVATLTAVPAAAVQCGPSESLRLHLAGKFGESRRIDLPHEDGDFVHQLWVNDEKQTWTFIVIATNGRACIVAAGKGGMHIHNAPKRAKPGVPS